MTEFKEPKNLKELIIQISERPAMFWDGHDFGRAAAYIEGYQQARSQLLPSEQDLILRDLVDGCLKCLIDQRIGLGRLLSKIFIKKMRRLLSIYPNYLNSSVKQIKMVFQNTNLI